MCLPPKKQKIAFLGLGCYVEQFEHFKPGPVLICLCFQRTVQMGHGATPPRLNRSYMDDRVENLFQVQSRWSQLNGQLFSGQVVIIMGNVILPGLRHL